MTSFVALDFETANQYRSSVCSIGLVFVEDFEITETFYELIKPCPNYYSPFCTQIHGLSQSDTENARLFPEIWAELLPKIKDLPLVAHNSTFGLLWIASTYQSLLLYLSVSSQTTP